MDTRSTPPRRRQARRAEAFQQTRYRPMSHAQASAVVSKRAYPASRTKRRRSTRDEVEARRAVLADIADKVQPATVRQVFYQATVRGLVEKTEQGYDKVQRDLVDLRRSGVMPWEWIVDNTRARQQPLTFADPAEAVQWLTEPYRKSLWQGADCQVQVGWRRTR